MARPSRRAPLVSNGVAGTQEGSCRNTSSGLTPSARIRSHACRTYSAPSTPQTLTSSCGSATTALVPCGTAMRANSSGVSMVLSIWICESISPGSRMRPAASYSRAAA